MRSPHAATRDDLRSPQLDKAHAQQQGPSTAKINKKKKKKKEPKEDDTDMSTKTKQWGPTEQEVRSQQGALEGS